MDKPIFTLPLLLVIGLCMSPSLGHHHCGPPPNHKAPHECCAFPELVDPAIMKTCVDKYGGVPGGPPPSGPPPAHGGGGPPHGPPPGCLTAQCLFNATNGGSADWNPDEWKAKIKSSVDSEEWIAIYEAGIDECIAKVNAKELPPPMPVAEGGETCDMKYAIMGRCLFFHALLACPADSYKNSAECDEVKAFAEKCSKM